MIKVTLIRPSGCQHCVQVKGTLEKLKTDYPDLTIEEVEATTPKGQALIMKYGILSPPGPASSVRIFSNRHRLASSILLLIFCFLPKRATLPTWLREPLICENQKQNRA